LSSPRRSNTIWTVATSQSEYFPKKLTKRNGWFNDCHLLAGRFSCHLTFSFTSRQLLSVTIDISVSCVSGTLVLSNEGFCLAVQLCLFPFLHLFPSIMNFNFCPRGFNSTVSQLNHSDLQKQPVNRAITSTMLARSPIVSSNYKTSAKRKRNVWSNEVSLTVVNVRRFVACTLSKVNDLSSNLGRLSPIRCGKEGGWFQDQLDCRRQESQEGQRRFSPHGKTMPRTLAEPLASKHQERRLVNRGRGHDSNPASNLRCTVSYTWLYACYV
jgi:hypothetical protein